MISAFNQCLAKTKMLDYLRKFAILSGCTTGLGGGIVTRAYKTSLRVSKLAVKRLEDSSFLRIVEDRIVHKSVLEAIREGFWDFEPKKVEEDLFDPTGAMPGTREKLAVMAERVKSGLPLWHGGDRTEYDDEH